MEYPKTEEVIKFLIENEIDFEKVGEFVRIYEIVNEKDLAMLVHKFKPYLLDGALKIICDK